MTAALAERLRGRPFGLALSSGFFGFHHHAGVVGALEELGLRPARVAGTSAGALVGALLAAGLPGRRIRDELVGLGLADFADPVWPFRAGGPGLLAGRRFRERLARVLPVADFAGLEVPLVVTAADRATGRLVRLAAGPLVDAVYASSAVPGLFRPLERGGERLVDGGAVEKTPLAPFLDGPRVEVVLVSYLRSPGTIRAAADEGRLRLWPGLGAFVSPTPAAERLERDRVSLARLRAAGVEVLVLGADRERLGPFSLHRGGAAFARGREAALAYLSQGDPDRAGCPELSGPRPGG